MEALEIVLLLSGIACMVVSYLLPASKEKETAETVKREITPEETENIKRQVEDIIEQHMTDVEEKTEITLDKISNTKILEMNEYSETILSEINRNHNETMFLYDMLNEKAKEIKNIVRDVNIAKTQAEAMMASKNVTESVTDNKTENAETGAKAEGKETDAANTGSEEQVKPKRTRRTTKKTEDIKVEVAKKTTEKPATKAKKVLAMDKEEEVVPANTSVSFEAGTNNNEQILKLHKEGKSNLDIAKELNLGMGEVKLVIDLFTGGRK